MSYISSDEEDFGLDYKNTLVSFFFFLNNYPVNYALEASGQVPGESSQVV